MRSDLDPEDGRLGNAVNDRADDDAHRASHARLAEAQLHRLVGEQEDGHADQHPQGELPAVEDVLGLADEVEGNRCDQRPGAEPAGMPTRRAGTSTQQANRPASRRDDAPSSPRPNASSTGRVAGGRRLLVDRLDLQHEPVHRDDTHA